MGHGWVGDLFQRLVTVFARRHCLSRGPGGSLGTLASALPSLSPGTRWCWVGLRLRHECFFVSLSGGRGLTRLFPG